MGKGPPEPKPPPDPGVPVAAADAVESSSMAAGYYIPDNTDRYWRNAQIAIAIPTAIAIGVLGGEAFDVLMFKTLIGTAEVGTAAATTATSAAAAGAIANEIEEVAPEAIVANAARGRAFQGVITRALGLEENWAALFGQTANGSYRVSKPDLFSATNITEIKDVLHQTFTRQLQAQANVAQMSNVPFSVIFSDRNRWASKPLLDAVTGSGGFAVRASRSTGQFIQYYDPLTRSWISF
jgi:hypothetical protein